MFTYDILFLIDSNFHIYKYTSLEFLESTGTQLTIS